MYKYTSELRADEQAVQLTILVRSPQIVNRGRRFGARGSVFSCRSEAKPRPIWKKTDPIYLVVVLYRHKHCRPQKVELDLACRDSTTTK
jgi:hypothetical protein